MVHCTPRWFEKPKFHILLHLPQHIWDFGPPILFATETFESYNALICVFSVHSNRQAPSHDIGQAFANTNRLWHLLSGAKIYMCESEDVDNFKNWRDKQWDSVKRSLEDENLWKAVHLEKPTLNDFQAVGEHVKALFKNSLYLQKVCGVKKHSKFENTGEVYVGSILYNITYDWQLKVFIFRKKRYI